MVEKFNQFEKKYELLNRHYEGFYYWGHVRFDVYNMLIADGMKHVGKNLIDSRKRIKGMLSCIRNSIFRNPLLKVKNRKILFLTSPRRMKEGNTYMSIYTDDIAGAFGENAYTAEYPYTGTLVHQEPIGTPGVLYLDYIFSYYKVCSLLHKKKYKNVQSVGKEIAEWLQVEIEDYFGIHVDSQKIANLFANRYFRMYYELKPINRLLEKINPELVVVVCSYSRSHMPFVEAAKRKKIRVIELQHGVMGRGHPAYNYPEKANHNFFPDEIFLFSEYWKHVTRFPISEEMLITTGFPYLEKSVGKYRNEVKKKSKTNILVISQLNCGHDLAKVITELVSLLEQRGIDYHMIYKLHPSEDAKGFIERFPLLTNDRIEIIGESEKELYYYMAHSDIQIGMFSTAIYEGLYFELTTYLYETVKTKEYMVDLCEKGYARMFSTATDLLKKMDSSHQESSKEYRQFFAEGGKEKIIFELKSRLS